MKPNVMVNILKTKKIAYRNFIGEWNLAPQDVQCWEEILLTFHSDCNALCTSGIRVQSSMNKEYDTIHILIILSDSKKETWIPGRGWPGVYEPFVVN